jgi:anti-sigma factor RsiW
LEKFLVMKYPCPPVETHVLYGDGELAVSARKDYETHLAECALCREKLRRLRLLSAAVRAEVAASVSKAELEAGFERLQQRIKERQERRQRRFRRHLLWGIPVAAAVVLFLLFQPVFHNAAFDPFPSTQGNRIIISEHRAPSTNEDYEKTFEGPRR